MVVRFGEVGPEFHLDDRLGKVIGLLEEIDNKPVGRYLQKLIQEDYSQVSLNQPKVKQK